jgi:GH25 family lysozyme M1 (1,4-beta-N-acetylmuramidase)
MTTKKQTYWGIDISTYQSVQQNYPLMKENGCRFVVVRAGQNDFYDDKVDAHALVAKHAGLIVGLYFWFDPCAQANVQAEFFQEKIDLIKPNFVCVDAEQWWSQWDQWEEAIAGKRAWSLLSKLDPSRISDVYYKAMTWLETRNDFVMLYTGAWFMSGYSPRMLEWASQKKLWLADYSYIVQNNIHNVNWDKFQALLEDLPGLDVAGMYGDNLILHQFTSSTIFPGIVYNTDVNKVTTSNVEYLKFLGVNPEFEGTPYSVLQDILPIRRAPHPEGCVVDIAKKGDVIYVTGFDNGFAELTSKTEGEKRYVSIGTPYIERL